MDRVCVCVCVCWGRGGGGGRGGGNNNKCLQSELLTFLGFIHGETRLRKSNIRELILVTSTFSARAWWEGPLAFKGVAWRLWLRMVLFYGPERRRRVADRWPKERNKTKEPPGAHFAGNLWPVGQEPPETSQATCLRLVPMAFRARAEGGGISETKRGPFAERKIQKLGRTNGAGVRPRHRCWRSASQANWEADRADWRFWERHTTDAHWSWPRRQIHHKTGNLIFSSVALAFYPFIDSITDHFSWRLHVGNEYVLFASYCCCCECGGFCCKTQIVVGYVYFNFQATSTRYFILVHLVLLLPFINLYCIQNNELQRLEGTFVHTVRVKKDFDILYRVLADSL